MIYRFLSYLDLNVSYKILSFPFDETYYKYALPHLKMK